jgi:hypothetical protein
MVVGTPAYRDSGEQLLGSRDALERTGDEYTGRRRMPP